MELELIPELPNEIVEASKRDNLVLFVGSGLSMRMGASNWEKFAENVLNQLIDNGLIDHNSKDQIKDLSPRKKLSIAKIIAAANNHKIDYESSIIPKKENNECKIYDYINQIECKVITTNYDDFLHKEPKSLLFDLGEEKGSSKSLADGKNIITDRTKITRYLLDEDNIIIHLHGCFKGSSPHKLIITTEDYLDLYGDPIIINFLKELFYTGKYTILFLGYGLEEMEILEHLLRKGEAKKSLELNKFWLEGFFSHQEKIIRYLDGYYKENFGVQIIPYNRDIKDFEQIDDIIEDWAYKIQAPKLRSTTQFQLLKETLNNE